MHKYMCVCVKHISLSLPSMCIFYCHIVYDENTLIIIWKNYKNETETLG